MTIEFDPKDRAGKGIGEIPHKVMVVCPKYVDEQTPAPIREWLRAITAFQKLPEILKTVRQLERRNRSAEEPASH